MLGTNKIVAFVAVTDYEKARAFYEKTLGLKFISQDNFALVMEGNGTRIRMAKVPNHQPAQFTVLGWNTSDIEKQVSELQAGGVKFERYPWLPKDGLPIWVAPGGDGGVVQGSRWECFIARFSCRGVAAKPELSSGHE